MIKKLRQQLVRAEQLFRHMRLLDAVSVFLLEAIRQRSRLTVRIGSVELIIRTRTPDLTVAFSSLIGGDYNEIHVDNVSVIVDAGANIGTSAIAFAQKYPNATIIAIEPEAENFGILEENVRPWINIRPLKAALTAKGGEMQLLDRGTGPWGYTVTDSQQTVGELGQTVCCITLDQVLDRFGFTFVDILKLDIEGGEKDVLENSGEWIGNVGVLVAELHDRIIPGCEEAFDKATRLFRQHTIAGEKRIAYR